jgi:hypothetical protein
LHIILELFEYSFAQRIDSEGYIFLTFLHAGFGDCSSIEESARELIVNNIVGTAILA